MEEYQRSVELYAAAVDRITGTIERDFVLANEEAQDALAGSQQRYQQFMEHWRDNHKLA